MSDGLQREYDLLTCLWNSYFGVEQHDFDRWFPCHDIEDSSSSEMADESEPVLEMTITKK
jgi:hypothetical protein